MAYQSNKAENPAGAGGHSSICDDVGATRKYIVYGGDDEFPVSGDVTVISLPRFMQKLGSY